MRSYFNSSTFQDGHHVQLIFSGEDYFRLLHELIAKARHHISLQAYIFEDDTTGRQVAVDLKEAAGRGVKVSLVLDAFGSSSFEDTLVKELTDAGVAVKIFSPILFPERWRVGRRLHHKILSVDSETALLGGINIADKYRGSEKKPAWLDFAVLVKGPVCTEIFRLCEQISGRKFIRKKIAFGKRNKGSVQVPDERKAAKPEVVPHLPVGSGGNGNVHVKLSNNDWFRRKNEVSRGYRSAFRQAESSITIVAGYFLPGRIMRRILRKAAKRGVKVKLILQGVTDIQMMKRASDYLYPWLLRNNIQIYEWNRSVLHAKMAIVDEKWVTVGSYNLNHLSHYSSIETNMEVLDKHFANRSSEAITDIMSKCTEITPEEYSIRKGIFQRAADWLFYRLIRWSMRVLFTFTTKE